MYDNLDLGTKNVPIINRLYKRADLVFYKTEYGRDIYKIPKYKIKLTFCKVWNKTTGEYFGHNDVWINFNPHKIFNNNLHNGNDLNACNAIKTIINVFDYLDIKQDEYNEITPIAIEFGVNVLIKKIIDEVNNIIDNIKYFKGSVFLWNVENKEGRRIFSKKAGTEKKKEVKAYNKSEDLKDKGIDLKDIDKNILRFELRYFRDALKRELKIYDLNDLINPKTFEIVAKCLIESLDFLLIIEPKPNKEFYTKKDYEYLVERSDFAYWEKLHKLSLTERKNRNMFNLERKKYNSISKIKQWFNDTIISKILEMQICDIFPKGNETKKHPLNLDKQKDLENLENLKSVTFSPRARGKGEKVTNKENERVCLVTGYNISMQSKNSRFLTEVGLEWYRINEYEKYKTIAKAFIKNKKIYLTSSKDLNYYIAHNIRNSYHNPKRCFIKVSPIQLSLFL